MSAFDAFNAVQSHVLHAASGAYHRGINDRCRALQTYAETLVDGFGVPEQLRYAEMLHPENRPV